MDIKRKNMKFSILPAILVALISIRVHADTTKPITPIPTPYSALTPPVDPNNFTFIVTGDNRPPSAGHGIMPVCVEICKEIELIHPNFVFWTGDTIYGYTDTPSEANSEYDGFLGAAALCGVPVFNAIGNHEATLDPGMETIYTQRMGALYGSTDYGNSHFISLNTDPIVDGKVDAADIDPDQLAWLQADLAANSKAANIFVFMHHYVFGPPDPDNPTSPDTGFASVDTRDTLHKIFVKYGVRAVFCGHAHLYYHVVHDGVDYYISGNAGAPLDADPEDGGYYGYLTVTVNGSTITTDERSADTLYETTLSGNDGVSPTAVVEIDAPYEKQTTISGVIVKLPAGKTYTATATDTYKGKTKPVVVTVLSTSASNTPGVELVRVGANLPGSRTTVITVTAN